MTARPRTSDPLAAALRQHDPAAGLTTSAPEVAGAFDEIAEAIMRQPVEQRRASRRYRPAPRVRVALIVVALAVVIGGVATAAVVLDAHTGLFASGPNAAVGGPGEELNPAAADFDAVALKLSADIPYPAAYASWRDWVLSVNFSKANEPNDGGAFPAGLISTGALRGSFAASAFCAWVSDWRQATLAGDSAEAAQAERTITAAPSWPAVTAEDPNPNPASPNDPGAERGTLFGWLLPYRNAVTAGDQAKVEQLLASGYGDGKCWLADPTWMTQLHDHPAWSTMSTQQLATQYETFLAGQHS